MTLVLRFDLEKMEKMKFQKLIPEFFLQIIQRFLMIVIGLKFHNPGKIKEYFFC